MALETGYHRLEAYPPDVNEDSDSDHSPPTAPEVLVHTPENSRGKWNHIEDLDEFLTRVYRYHQRNGFSCMILSDIFELFQFAFIVLFSTFLVDCVDYPLLFRDKFLIRGNVTILKIAIKDAVLPAEQCVENLPPFVVWCLILAGLFWTVRALRFLYSILLYWDTRSFFRNALKITTNDLINMTWHDVQLRLKDAQLEHRMCIHKRELTELDIYNRILRFKNYQVAMINQSLIPVKFQVPFLGEMVFVTHGLRYNLAMIFFWGPWSPFRNNWHLRSEYRKRSSRNELSDKLAHRIIWIGLANLLLSPFIFVWQILNAFFSYTDVIRRDPSLLGARRWSLYSRLYLRHFNELDHEFDSRLASGYKPSRKYISSFHSPMLTIFAKNIAFFTGSLLAVLIVLTLIDEDVLSVEHVITTMTLLGVVVHGCRTFIPDENMVFYPERLMKNIIAHIHYYPDHWSDKAHTYRVRDDFSQLFQYKMTFLLTELLSPLITPFILLLFLPRKTLSIVDFFRNFTVDIAGVGDVCSFAQMDIKKHGNSMWFPDSQSEASEYHQAEDGKVELSLIHFTLTNPSWRPPEHSVAFINNLKDRAQRDVTKLAYLNSLDNPMSTSFTSSDPCGGLMASVAVRPYAPISLLTGLASPQVIPELTGSLEGTPDSELPALRGVGVSRSSGPLKRSVTLTNTLTSGGPMSNSGGPIITSLTDSDTLLSPTNTLNVLSDECGGWDYAANNMRLSALYIHELRRRPDVRASANLSFHEGVHIDRPDISLPPPATLGTSSEQGPTLNPLHQPLIPNFNNLDSPPSHPSSNADTGGSGVSSSHTYQPFQ